jgi:Leu/Phe-tRNA-protein transferase
MTKLQSQSTSSRRQHAGETQTIEEFIPRYLRRYINPYHGDFCFTRIFHFRLIAQLCSEGFLPIATVGVLLPKLHEHRCVVSLPQGFHLSKSVRKKSKKFDITINKAFDQVVEGCRAQHGSHCWLYPPLVDAFRSILQAGKIDAPEMLDFGPTGRMCPVRLYTVEVWNATTGELAGGELGYTVGSIYTSLTGFSREDGAGSVQLAALGKLLCRLGFSLWDLGMDMEYKNSLGSHPMPRKLFVEYVHSVRATKGHLVLPTGPEPVNAKTMIDVTIPTQSESVGGDSSATGTATNNDSQPNNAKQQHHLNHEHPFDDENSQEKKKPRNSGSTEDNPAIVDMQQLP